MGCWGANFASAYGREW